MKKTFIYLGKAFRNISGVEALLLTYDFLILLFAPSYLENYYFWSIALLCDLGIIASHGAWIHHSITKSPTPSPPESRPWRRTEGLIIRSLVLTFFIGVFLFQKETNDQFTQRSNLVDVANYSWYIISFTAIYECFYCVLKTLHAIDTDWLRGSDGHIGLPNTISIIRIALAICIPHIYYAQSFGDMSNTIATIILGIALSTDAIDGHLARHLQQITRAGKALDPLGDKLIFYPVAVGLVFATSGECLYMINDIPTTLLSAAITAVVARDVAVITWYFVFGRHYQSGVSAGIVDKMRAIILSAWLISTALAITVPDTTFGDSMAGISSISLLAAGIASPLSLVRDFIRIHKRGIH